MNCKPGDLAVVVDSDIGENVGMFVDVIEAYRPTADGIVLLADGRVWLCRARGRIVYRNIFGEAAIAREGPIPDAVLRPIRPEPMSSNTETQKNLEVSV